MNIPNWFEFSNSIKFDSSVGLCGNLHNILGDKYKPVESKFLRFLNYKDLWIRYPIGQNSYATLKQQSYGMDSTAIYDKHLLNGTLYVGKQLELRKHLYKQFRIWLRNQK